jgi:imidazolonepropionase-like amidohydrolase
MLLILLSLLQDSASQTPDEFLAITNVRILTMAKGDIEIGSLLIKNGKIAEIGKELKIPAGAVTIDGTGSVAMPGFINAYSSIGISPRSAGGAGTTPHYLAYDEFNPIAEIIQKLPRTGFTTLAISPSSGVIAGQGLVLKLNGLSKESMVLSKTAFLKIASRPETSVKENLRRDFESAKKFVEAERKYEEEKKKYDEEKKKREEEEKKKKEKSEEKKEPAKEQATQQPPIQEPKAPQKAEPRLQPVIQFLKGELPGLIQSDEPAGMAHFWQIMKEMDSMKPRMTFIAGLETYKALEQLAERKSSVLLRPRLEFYPYTRNRLNPPAEMARAGVKIVLIPLDDDLKAHEAFLFHVAELVKYGLDRETALKSFTIVAAELLGLETQIGSLEVGKDGDVVLLSGDPFSPTTRVVRSIIQGKPIYEESHR